MGVTRARQTKLRKPLNPAPSSSSSLHSLLPDSRKLSHVLLIRSRLPVWLLPCFPIQMCLPPPLWSHCCTAFSSGEKRYVTSWQDLRVLPGRLLPRFPGVSIHHCLEKGRDKRNWWKDRMRLLEGLWGQLSVPILSELSKIRLEKSSPLWILILYGPPYRSREGYLPHSWCRLHSAMCTLLHRLPQPSEYLIRHKSQETK